MSLAMTLAYAAALAGAFGLIIGSFLNVVAYRLPRGESVMFPASHCPSCDTPIKPYDNVPVLSWLVLRGRCRSCHTRSRRAIRSSRRSPRPCSWLVVLDKGADEDALLGLAFVILLVPVTLIDLDHRIIPNTLMLIGTVVSVGILLLTDPERSPSTSSPRPRPVASCSSPRSPYPAGMGMGDVKLAAVMGLFLGRNVGPAMLVALVDRIGHRRPHHRPQGGEGRSQDRHPVRPVLGFRRARRPVLRRRDRRLVPRHLRLT